jgi:hypothetical protein
MATIIDALVVSLNLDGSGFKAGAKQVDKGLKDSREGVDRTAKEFEAKGKLMAEFLGQVRNQALGIAAIITTGLGLKAFASNVTASDAAVGRVSRTIGLSTEELSRWQNAAQRAGGSAEAITGTLQGLSQQFQEYRATGNAAFVGMSTVLHVDPQKANGEFKKTTQYVLELTEAIQRLHLDPQFASYLLKSGGIDDATINMMLRGRGQLEQLVQTSKYVTQEEADAAERRREQFAQAMQSTTDLGRKLMVKLKPAIDFVLNSLVNLADWFGEHPTMFATFAGGIAIASTLAMGALIGLKVKGFLALVSAMFKVPAAAAAAGAGMEAAAVQAAAANATMTASLGALVKMLGQVALVGYLAHEALKNLDPNDNFGSWMDEHSSIASWLDNAASHFGMGRSYNEQRQNTERRRREAKDKGEPETIPQTPAERRLSGRSGAKVTPQQREQAEADIAKLVGMGWTRAQAAGIAANIQAESKGNYKAVGDNGQAYGIAQWHKDRQLAFSKWAGKDIRDSNRDEQLAFINFELREGSERKAGLNLMRARDAGSAGDIVSRMYERPANTDGDAAKRAGMAVSLLQPGPQVDQALQVGAGAAVSSTTNHNTTSSSSSHSETHIGEVKVVLPNATDAESTARGLSSALSRHMDLSGQANYGLTG